MYYVITKDNIYKFKAMKDMKDCDIIVPGSVVYNGDAPTQLMDNFSPDRDWETLSLVIT